MRKCRISLIMVVSAVLPAIAQSPDAEVRRAIPVEPQAEIRRAEPVTPSPGNYVNPAWVERVPAATAIPVERVPTPVATPVPASRPPAVPEPIPRATAIPVLRAEPVIAEPTVPAASPYQQMLASPEAGATQADPNLAAEIAADGEAIRFGPGSMQPGVNRSLVAANGFYKRKQYEMAIFEYEKFLISDPSANDRDGALFRLAESHRFLGNDRAAREGYQRLLSEFSKGEFVGAGAFRLGEIFFASGNYGGAIELYRKAAANTKEREVQLTADFFIANALDKLVRPTEALVAFQSIAEGDVSNPYREDARFYVAEALSKSNRKEEALAAFESLGSEASKPPMQAEALIKAAALAAELGKNDRAKTLFESALAHPEIGSWRGVARLGLLRIAYSAEDYQGAAAIAEVEIQALPEDARSEAMLIVANANRQLGNKDVAVAGYNRILAEFPKSDAALQARFQRLTSLDVADSGELIAEIDSFLRESTNPRERAQANLMKAETLFKDGKFAEAATLYEGVAGSKLPNRLKEQALFKLAWCQAQGEALATAEKTFRDFIKTYPKSELLPSAQTQLATVLQRSENYADAVREFDRLLKGFPDAKERELALQQKALTLGQLEDYPNMILTFEQLLSEFPKSQAAAQAHFWIGWAKFENKDYAGAVTSLKAARDADSKQYADRSTIRIILAHYYNKDRDAVAAEAGALPSESVPPEVTAWLASGYFADGDYTKAEQFLSPMVAADTQRTLDPEVYLQLARARIALSKFGAAEEPIAKFLATARDPASRARGLLLSAEVALGQDNMDAADRAIEESLLLQPEGRLNAEARMLNGRSLAKRGRSDDAARAFATVAILYDDPILTPEALKQASAAFLKAGNAVEAEKLRSELLERFPESARKD
jgi:TolA-binding protein